MHRFHSMALALALFVFNLVGSVNAGLYVINPFAKSTCKAGQDCLVTWLDDGETPLLPNIGVCTLGLFHGKQKLVQTLQPIDVSSTRSFTFKPNAAAGPDSDAYYLSFISTSLRVKANNSDTELLYAAFSPFFSLEGMSGSFDQPLAAATSTKPIPSSLAHGAQTKPLSTITMGKLNTSLPPLPSQTLLSIPASSIISDSPAASTPTSSPVASPSSASPTTSSGSAKPTSNGAIGASQASHLLIGLSLAVLITFNL